MSEVVQWLPNQDLQDQIREVWGGRGDEDGVDFSKFKELCTHLMQQEPNPGYDDSSDSNDDELLSAGTGSGLESADEVEEYDTVRALFDKLDARQQGYLGAAELKGLMPHAKLADIDRVLAKINTSKTGRITFDEFYEGFDFFVEEQGADEDQVETGAFNEGSVISPSRSPDTTGSPQSGRSRRTSSIHVGLGGKHITSKPIFVTEEEETAAGDPATTHTSSWTDSLNPSTTQDKTRSSDGTRSSSFEIPPETSLRPGPEGLPASGASYGAFGTGTLMGTGTLLNALPSRGSEDNDDLIPIHTPKPGAFLRAEEEQQRLRHVENARDASLTEAQIRAKNQPYDVQIGVESGSGDRRGGVATHMPPDRVSFFNASLADELQAAKAEITEANTSRRTPEAKKGADVSPEQRVDDDGDEMSTLRARCDATVEKIIVIERKYRMLSRLGAQLELENGDLERRLASTLADLSEKASEADDLSEKVDALQTKNAAVLGHVRALRSHNYDLGVENEEASAALEAEARVRRRLEAEIREKDGRIAELQETKSNDMRSERFEKLKQSKVLRDAMGAKRRLVRAEEALAAEKKDKAALAKRILALEIDLGRKDQIISGLQERLKVRHAHGGRSLAWDMLKESKSVQSSGTTGARSKAMTTASHTKSRVSARSDGPTAGKGKALRTLRNLTRTMRTLRAFGAGTGAGSASTLHIGTRQKQARSSVPGPVTYRSRCNTARNLLAGLNAAAESMRKKRSGDAEAKEISGEDKNVTIKPFKQSLSAATLAPAPSRRKGHHKKAVSMMTLDTLSTFYGKTGTLSKKDLMSSLRNNPLATHRKAHTMGVPQRRAKTPPGRVSKAKIASLPAIREGAAAVMSKHAATKTAKDRTKARTPPPSMPTKAKKTQRDKKQTQETDKKPTQETAKKPQQNPQAAVLNAPRKTAVKIPVLHSSLLTPPQPIQTTRSHHKGWRDCMGATIELASGLTARMEIKLLRTKAEELLRLLNRRLGLQKGMLPPKPKPEEAPKPSKSPLQMVAVIDNYFAKDTEKTKAKTPRKAPAAPVAPKLLPRPDANLSHDQRRDVAILATYLNHCLGDDELLSKSHTNLIPIDPNSDDLVHKVSDGLLLAKFINVASPCTIDLRALNTKHWHNPLKHPFLHHQGGIGLHTAEQDAKTLDMQGMLENLTLVVESAKAIGVQLGDVRPSHLLHSYRFPSRAIRFIWKLVIVRAEAFAQVKKQPDLVRLTVSEHDGDWTKAAAATAQLGSRQTLLRWVHHHRTRGIQMASTRAQELAIAAGFAHVEESVIAKQMRPLGLLTASLVFHSVLDNIHASKRVTAPTTETKASNTSASQSDSEDWLLAILEAKTNKDRARLFRLRLKDAGADETAILVPESIELSQSDRKASGPSDQRWMQGFAALGCMLGALGAGLFSVEDHKTTAEDSARQRVKAQILTDDVGDRLERAFRMWINSMSIEGVYIQNLFRDTRDGLVLLRALDSIVPGSVPWKKVEKRPGNKFKKISNCNLVVKIGKSPTFNFSLVSIDGSDIHAGNRKLILALVWQMMRFHVCQFLQTVFDKRFGRRGGKGMRRGASRRGRSKMLGPGGDAAIIEWANTMVKKAFTTRAAPPKTMGVDWRKYASVRSFKDAHLRMGFYFLLLLWAVDDYIVDWNVVTRASSEQDCVLNARYAISVARKLGATIFLLPEDITELNSKMILTFVGGILSLAT